MALLPVGVRQPQSLLDRPLLSVRATPAYKVSSARAKGRVAPPIRIPNAVVFIGGLY